MMKHYRVTLANADGSEREEVLSTGRAVSVAVVVRLAADIDGPERGPSARHIPHDWFGRKAGAEYVLSISRDAVAARTSIRAGTRYGTVRLAALTPERGKANDDEHRL
jgi:hypothetical protein